MIIIIIIISSLLLVWVSFSVFTIFCITSFGDCTRPQHRETTLKGLRCNSTTT